MANYQDCGWKAILPLDTKTELGNSIHFLLSNYNQFLQMMETVDPSQNKTFIFMYCKMMWSDIPNRTDEDCL